MQCELLRRAGESAERYLLGLGRLLVRVVHCLELREEIPIFSILETLLFLLLLLFLRLGLAFALSKISKKFDC